MKHGLLVILFMSIFYQHADAACKLVQVKFNLGETEEDDFLMIRERADYRSREVGKIFAPKVIQVCDIPGKESSHWKMIKSEEGIPTFVHANPKYVSPYSSSTGFPVKVESKGTLFSRPGYNYRSYQSEKDFLEGGKKRINRIVKDYYRQLEDLKDEQEDDDIQKEREINKVKRDLQKIRALGEDWVQEADANEKIKIAEIEEKYKKRAANRKRLVFLDLKESIADAVGSPIPKGLVSAKQMQSWAEAELSKQEDDLPTRNWISDKDQLRIKKSTVMLNEFGERELYYFVESTDGTDSGWISADRMKPVKTFNPIYKQAIDPKCRAIVLEARREEERLAKVITDIVTTSEGKKISCKRPTKKACNSVNQKKCQKVPATGNKRKKYDRLISKVARQTGIHPAIIKAQIHSESSFDPNLENKIEQKAYKKYLNNGGRHPGNQLWGRGLGQFGADNAHQYGLAWYQSIEEVKKLHPELKNLSGEALKKKRMKKKIYLPGDSIKVRGLGRVTLNSVFKPEASIKAIARLYSNNLNAPMKIEVRDSSKKCLVKEVNGKCRTVDIKKVMPEKEKYRFAVLSYIRGHNRLRKASQNYMYYNEEVPCYVAYSARMAPMKKHKTGICATNSIIGICDSSNSLFDEYSKDFAGIRL